MSELWSHDESVVAIPAGGATAILSAMSMALYAAFGRTRIRVLISRHEHPGAYLPFAGHAGYEVQFIEDSCLFDPMLFRAKVERVRPDVILLSPVTYDVLCFPVEDLVATLKAVPNRPVFIVDAAQSLGLLPLVPSVDSESGIDLVVASAHKWLGGPAGSGLLWMSSRLAQRLRPFYACAEPLDENAHLGFLEASGGQDFARLAALENAIARYQNAGPTFVLSQSRWLASYFHSRACVLLSRAGFLYEFRGLDLGMVLYEFRSWNPYALYDHLNANGIHTKLIKCEASWLWRLGFPYYETPERLDLALVEIARFLEGEIAAHSPPASTEPPRPKNPTPGALN